ncbi:MAG: electron transfer flavoprotein subunit alpha/FixB family protein [Gammaproteobacteria bacterium]|nr:electron transfer flavoprotein subunit alpha/FixB family protein [Gammaproteobacteria bacterium]MBT8111551.1 electron transfer flavoprotein subunit alpha/FixB family protein [Gammaproteobacteria bacterium]NND47400.1 electron transfer flavoprotein subunit alpha/FixB family protein [Woeseiaceae bacterium]NNL46249.1 electron transfer flavoprotein subunit alpha/FixB family protein [Woeseiaceae bacterium]
MTKVLVIAEHDGAALNPSTAKCVSCAKQLEGAEIDIAVFAASAAAVAAEAAQISGVGRVLTIEREENDPAVAAILAPQIAALASAYSHVFGPSTAFGKDVMPRVAALLDVNQISDIMSVEGPHVFKRPIYAGNAIVTVEAPAESPLVATVRTASYQAAEGGNSATIESTNIDAEIPTHTRFVEVQTGQSDRPDLQSAAKVVSGGRALGSEENFELIYKLADKLGAAIGSSRAAVDAGYVPPETQVGQTGQIIAPDLYIAIGISGAIQHITGIKDAGTIVAINKDEEAPIFEVSDIGLVGDLFSIVPELTNALD